MWWSTFTAQPLPLFVGGEVIYSCEGTTQGDPLAVAIFAIAVRPLIDRLVMAQATQIWFADDAASGGKLQALRRWWDSLLRFSPLFGYHVNVSKSWMLVKPENLQEATTISVDTGLRITTDSGVRHLGPTRRPVIQGVLRYRKGPQLEE